MASCAVMGDSMPLEPRRAEEEDATLLRATFFRLPLPFGCPRFGGTTRVKSSLDWS